MSETLPSAAAPGEGAPGLAPDDHTVRIRDLRLRFGAPEIHGAQCACGWTGEEHRERSGERLARRDGRAHAEAERLAFHAQQPRRPAVS